MSTTAGQKAPTLISFGKAVKLMLQKGLALPDCRWKLKLERDEFRGAAFS